MPNYDYRCQSCGKVFEVFQSMTAKKLKKCPKSACEGSVERLVGSGSALIFKGPGFYSTDYRSPSYNRDKAADK